MNLPLLNKWQTNSLRTLLILSWCCLSVIAYAQPGNEKSTQNNIIEQRIETIAEINEDEALDYTTLFDELNYFFEHPINLNSASKESLQQLHLLSEFQINNLLNHIAKNGRLLSIYELQSIEGMNQETIFNILPFVKVSADVNAPHITLKDLFKNGKSELFLRYTRILEEQEGFAPIDDSTLAENPNRRFLGDPNRLYMRYRFKYRQNVSFGFTADKDAGEEFFQGSQPNGFDFYSAHLFLKDFGHVKALAIGDYQAQFGQGLTFWSGLAFGKSALVTTIKRNPLGLRAYTSADENLFLRGAAATIGAKDFEFTAFYSRKRIDANLAAVDSLAIDNDVPQITSFQLTGIHATPAELFDKDAILETHLGGHLAYKKRQLNVGVTGVVTRYDADLNRNLTINNQFEFNANQNAVLGADYSYVLRNFNFFGEISRSENGGIAYINGALIALDPRLTLSLFHRNYQRDYQQLNSVAIGENSRNANERGVFLGFEAKLHKHWTLASYFDRFSFPWLRFNTDAPSNGFEYLAQLTYRPTRSFNMYARIRHRDRPRNTSEDITGIDFVVSEVQTNYRYNAIFQVTKALQLKSRIEFIRFQRGSNPIENGVLLAQDIAYRPLGSKLSFNFRYALFDTESFNARLYSYESDVLYAFSIPAYFNRGSRTYLLMRWRIKRGIDLWLRWAQWFYNDRDTVGSGLNTISSNQRNEVKAQLRFQF